MRLSTAIALLGSAVQGANVLFEGGTVISYDEKAGAVKVLHDSSVLIKDDRVDAIFPTAQTPALPANLERINVEGKILSPGFVDTHRHLWQSAYRTIASNTTLLEYMLRYGQFAAEPHFTPDDVYLGQVMGIWESLNAGVTSILDHAHHSWTAEHAESGLAASIDSQARIFHAYTIQQTPRFPMTEQREHYQQLLEKPSYKESATTLGLSYDNWVISPDETNHDLIKFIRETETPFLTVHSVGGPWTFANSPQLLHRLGILNTSMAVVFSHGSFFEHLDLELLRETNQLVSITPESESHYGHGNPDSHLFSNQASIGVDTHFTFSADILTQARMWLQTVRRTLFHDVLARWEIPTTNPMSVEQAFLMATRNGGLSLRRPDIGVLVPGAKADIVVFDTSSLNMLGWADAVAAVILHANVGDIEHVLVDGKFRKRDFKLVTDSLGERDIRARFLASAKRLQKIWAGIPIPQNPSPTFIGLRADGGRPVQVDVQIGPRHGYEQSPDSDGWYFRTEVTGSEDQPRAKHDEL